jgi:hypothetical protein
MAKAIPAGIAFVKSEKGQKLLASLKEGRAGKERRVAEYERQVATTKDSEAKARWQRRLDRAREEVDDLVQREALAAQGIVGEGSVTEYRRNLLAVSWDAAPAEEKKRIEAKIAEMDARLAEMAKHPSAYQGVPGDLDVLDRLDAMGVGTLEFAGFAPAGPGRLVRFQLYPELVANAWTGATGLDDAGDDPVVNVQIGAGVRVSTPMRLLTPAIDWGVYRLLGLQIHEQGNYRGTAAGVALMSDIVISVSNLSVYNGQELFLPGFTQQLDARDFGVNRASQFSHGILNYDTEHPYGYLKRRAAFFGGLRDYPTIDRTARVGLTVRAFTVAAPGAMGAIMVPFTACLVADILEDHVYGNLVNPSASGRPGAVVKVAAREEGLSWEGEDQVRVEVARRRIPVWRD